MSQDVLLDRLLASLAKHGLSVQKGEGPDQLLLVGPKEKKTPQVFESLRQFKSQLLKRFAEPVQEVPQSSPQ